MSKYKTKNGETVREYMRPGVCQVCGHAAVQPDGHYYEDVKIGSATKRILVNVWCFECIPDRLRERFCPEHGSLENCEKYNCQILFSKDQAPRHPKGCI